MFDSSLSRDLLQFGGMPASEFLLHRPPMLLLDYVVEAGAEQTLCEWHVTSTAAFVVPERGVPSYVGIEHMAQCVAVHAGVRSRLAGLGPPLGFLLGTRHYRAQVEYFSLGRTYRAACRELIRDENGMGSYACSILLHDDVIAEGRLAVLEKERGRVTGGR
jgi:predicted hotdog family 3-hydroxylacyl-ACP dehydratase